MHEVPRGSILPQGEGGHSLQCLQGRPQEGLYQKECDSSLWKVSRWTEEGLWKERKETLLMYEFFLTSSFKPEVKYIIAIEKKKYKSSWTCSNDKVEVSDQNLFLKEQ